jgi:antitoxin VapB
MSTVIFFGISQLAFRGGVTVEQVVRLFKNGRSQAVRIPTAFRFEGESVFMRKDEETGDVILSRHPSDWSGFLATLDGLDVPDGFLAPPRDQPPSDPFADPHQ